MILQLAKRNYKIWAVLILGVILNSCYTDTIDSFSKFTFQFPIPFTSTHFNKAVPDTSSDFTNLFTYEQYLNNRDKINRAEVYQMNFWVDSLIWENGKSFDPENDKLTFEYVRYTIRFAKPISGNIFSDDENDFVIDNEIEAFVVAEFRDVMVEDYYRNPRHIIEVEQKKSEKVSELLKTRPYFFTVTEFGKVQGQTSPKLIFPLIRSRYDLVVRFEVGL